MPWQWSHKSKARKSRQERRQQATEGIAFELYQNRLLLGRPGDPGSDWEKASQIVRSPIRTTLFVSNRPLIKLRKPAAKVGKFICWDAPGWILFSLPKLEWLKLSTVPLIITGVGSLVLGIWQSREARLNDLLKTYYDQLDKLIFEHKLLTTQPKEGAMSLARGRTVATLRELDTYRRNELIAFLQASDFLQSSEEGKDPIISFRQQSLPRLNLQATNLQTTDFRQANLRDANLEGSNLSEANLGGADLDAANLGGADLSKANLREANLKGADLSYANLGGANLTLANLDGVNLEEAILRGANLARTYLGGANLAGANLGNANLDGAYLRGANLDGANLRGANLDGADLRGANLDGADLRGANLDGAILDEANLKGARLCRTTLPKDTNLNPNRDCKELGIDPKTGKVMP